MRFLFVLALLAAAPLPGLARSDKKLNLKPQEPKAEDPGSATHLIYQAPKPEERAPSAGKVSVNQTCTDQVGMIYKKGDRGYDGCLRTMDLAKPVSNDKRHNPSLGITIGR